MKNGVQLDMMSAIEGRDAGILKAVNHADSVNDNWSDKAYEELKRFLKSAPGEFMAEDLRAFAAMNDFPLPPNNRAWGGIIRKASKEELIRFVRHQQVSNPKAHCAYASVWIKA